MRVKDPLTENDRQFRCCFCCHVRIGTIVLGVFCAAVYLAVVTLGVVSLTQSPNPDQLKDDAQGGVIFTVNSSGSSFSSVDNYQLFPDASRDGCVMFAIVICLLFITLMLIYGAVASRPGYLIPFFCVQVFQFCIGCLTAVGYMTYAPNTRTWINVHGVEEQMTEVDEQKVQIFFIVFVIMVLSLKAYLIQMVWNCYRYLQIRNLNRSMVREYTVDPDTEMLLPPKYEDAMKMSPTGPSPPPYSA